MTQRVNGRTVANQKWPALESKPQWYLMAYIMAIGPSFFTNSLGNPAGTDLQFAIQKLTAPS